LRILENKARLPQRGAGQELARHAGRAGAVEHGLEIARVALLTVVLALEHAIAQVHCDV
jgi:hypothetical protein